VFESCCAGVTIQYYARVPVDANIGDVYYLSDVSQCATITEIGGIGGIITTQYFDDCETCVIDSSVICPSVTPNRTIFI
jgi:hypothetical protein